MPTPSKIQVNCPSCNHRLTVPAGNAGKSGRCPKCSGRVTVPAAPDAEPTDDRAAEARPPKPARKPGGSSTRAEREQTNPVDAAELERRAREILGEGEKIDPVEVAPRPRGGDKADPAQTAPPDEAEDDVAAEWNEKIRRMKSRKPPRRSRRKLLAVIGLAIVLLAGTGAGAWVVVAKRVSVPGLGGDKSGDDGSFARADEEELVLWYLDSEKHQLARSKLIPRGTIPASNGDPYVTVLVNSFDQGMVLHVVDERGPLRDGNEQHEWKLRPNVEGVIKGFDKATWTGELSKEVTAAGARVRFACASSGTTQLTVQLLQIELLQPDGPPKGSTVKTVWEGVGKAQCNTKEWSLVTVDLTEKAATQQPGRAFILIIEAAGDNCRISTSLDGTPNVIPAREEKFKNRMIDVADGHAIPAGTKRAQAAVYIKKR